MTPARQHKIWMLFLDASNPLWRQVLGEHTRQDFHNKVVKASALHYYRNGRTPAKCTPANVFARTLDLIARLKDEAERKALAERVKNFQEKFDSDRGFNVCAAAKLLEMKIDDARIAIDTMIFNRLSVFPSLLYDDKEPSRRQAAEEHYLHYRGAYHVWIRQESLWLRAALQVRSLIKVNDGHALRCKLNLPIIGAARRREMLIADNTTDEGWFEYDGFISIKSDSTTFWLFEKRESLCQTDNRGNYFVFATRRGYVGKDQKLTMCGSYLTLGQSEPRTIASSDIIMQRVTNDPDEIVGHMRCAKVLTASEAKRPESILKEAKKRD